jgi:hypothetical protein
MYICVMNIYRTIFMYHRQCVRVFKLLSDSHNDTLPKYDTATSTYYTPYLYLSLSIYIYISNVIIMCMFVFVINRQWMSISFEDGHYDLPPFVIHSHTQPNNALAYII